MRKCYFSISCTSYDDDFASFKKHTSRIGSKLLKKMGYQGKGLRINGQSIVNPIKVKELPHYVGFGYVRKQVGECSKKTSGQLHHILVIERIPRALIRGASRISVPR